MPTPERSLRPYPGLNWEQTLRHTGARMVVGIDPASVKSEGIRSDTVRKLPKYPFLLAVRGPGGICESFLLHFIRVS